MSARLDELQRACNRPVSRETLGRLETFEALFRKWNSQINLASDSTLDALWSRHILDSAQLVRYAGDARCWADMGSGGGLPGAVVAILLNGSCDVHLIESNRKKAAFLLSSLSTLGVAATVHALRVENAWDRIANVEIVSARALASLADLLRLAESPLSRPQCRALFHKGRDYRREIEESRARWDFDLIEHRSVVEDDSVILELVRPIRRT